MNPTLYRDLDGPNGLVSRLERIEAHLHRIDAKLNKLLLHHGVFPKYGVLPKSSDKSYKEHNHPKRWPEEDNIGWGE